jgi:hypothetical protein
VDVSSDGKQLKFPEYKGNNFFMTLGNIAATGSVELLFPHFETGACVTVSGTARYAVDRLHLAVCMHSLSRVCKCAAPEQEGGGESVPRCVIS